MYKNLDVKINDEVKKIIDEIGEDQIRAVGKLEFERPDDWTLINRQGNKNYLKPASSDIKSNRYFRDNIIRWVQEKLSVALWLGLDKAPKKRILDLGTGAGWFVYICRKLGHECYGTDILNRPEYEAGYNLLGIDIVGELTYPMQKMNLDGKFDYITTMRSFLGQRPQAWSKEEWKFFLEDMREHLNDNGVLYLACNSGNKLDKRYRDLPDNEKSFWGAKELAPWFDPYLIDKNKMIRGMKPYTLYITKEQIQKLLES